MALTERDLNIARKPPQTQKTPTQSKLPRRVPTPNSAPAATKWSSTTADRVAPAEKSAGEAYKAPGQASMPSAMHNRKSQQSMATPADKPLPGEKPLPSRPIARLSYSLSPTKDGRTLIDASEEPLHFTSVTGEKHDWPSLTPQSTSSTSTTPTSDSVNRSTSDVSANDSLPAITRASLMAAASTLTNVITRKASDKENRSLPGSSSSDSSYTSAVQSGSPTRLVKSSDLSVKKTRDPDTASLCEDRKSTGLCLDFPTRQASLRQRISDGSLVTPSGCSSHKFIAFTDFTKTRAASPNSTDSRQHSPSPASFSRPRPGSVSRTNSKTMKTASRIPVANTKKAKVVDVKRNRLSGSSTSSPVLEPSFGSRRLASPEALRILENGKMRRQLKRMGPDATVSGARVGPTNTGGGNAPRYSSDMPSLSHSLDTSPEGTLAPNSPMVSASDPHLDDVDAAYTGQDQIFDGERHEGVAESQNQLESQEQQDESESEYSDKTVPLASRPPPSTSPYTMPLQTIPSQAVLPTEDDWKQVEPYNALTRTLSHLEGKGSPPKTDVDERTLFTMFGHLKRGAESKKHNSATLAENAAAAEKYLAQNPSVAVEYHAETKNTTNAGSTRMSSQVRGQADVQPPCQGKRKQTMISKWSDSTPSDKALSPTADGIPTGQALSSVKLRQSTAESKDISTDANSIGHPSLIPTRVSTGTTRPSNDSVDAPAVSRRKSSPTLGEQDKQPGSVRTARERIKGTNTSFSRTTLSAESKRMTKLPRPGTKSSTNLETPPRGRRSLGGKDRTRQMNGASPKEPRSRSKSRYVLDKINGFFSGKHDRKSQGIPPVPKIDENNLKSRTTLNSYKVKVSTDGSPRQAAQLPKMPSLSPSTQTHLRSPSPTTTKTDETATIDSSSDTQSVQNLAEHILGKAQRETNPHRKERLLNFAKVLNDSLISAREAQISAETAQHAAKSAQMSCEMTQQSLAMLQRLAGAMVRKGLYRGY